MKAVIRNDGQTSVPLKVDFATDPELTESWLQQALFDSPELLNHLPQDRLNPITPLCRELALRGASSTVYLDIFAVRADGTPVLVECKLWRNPQARREVIGQILEYASLLHKRSYSDIEAQVRFQVSHGIWEAIKGFDKGVDQASFIDRFTHCLGSGEFDLIIAGDGIRSDLISITDLLSRSSTNVGQLSLMEVSVWKHFSDFILVASPPVRFKQESFSVTPIQSTAGASIIDEVTSSSSEQREKNRAFWDEFIKRASFDHPEQESPRHGGNNWVRMKFPEPAGWVTCYRTQSEFPRVGVFMTLNGERGEEVYENLMSRADELRTVLPEIGFDEARHQAPTVFIRRAMDIADESTTALQLEWLLEYSNRFVSLLRPILEDYADN